MCKNSFHKTKRNQAFCIPESEEFFVRPEVPRFGREAVEGAPVRLQEQLPTHQRLVRRLEAHLKSMIESLFTEYKFLFRGTFKFIEV